MESKRQRDALVLGYIRERAMQRLAVDDGDVASFRMQWDRSSSCSDPLSSISFSISIFPALCDPGATQRQLIAEVSYS